MIFYYQALPRQPRVEGAPGYHCGERPEAGRPQRSCRAARSTPPEAIQLDDGPRAGLKHIGPAVEPAHVTSLLFGPRMRTAIPSMAPGAVMTETTLRVQLGLG